jgi:7-cyano-7-deazaguanine synthase
VKQHDGVAIVSGGLDSVTMLYLLINRGKSPLVLSFDYGQRHKRELECARLAAESFDLPHHLVDLTSIRTLIGTSALTLGQEVPEGHYAADNMAATVVPNRNMIMLSIAAAAVISSKTEYVAAGMHAGDHAQYPDCRPEFIAQAHRAIATGNKDFIPPGFALWTPWIMRDKNYIAEKAYELKVPLSSTWSCYKGGTRHCGRCGTCVERLEAIASVTNAPEDWDQTEYEDKEYWKQAIAEFKHQEMLEEENWKQTTAEDD